MSKARATSKARRDVTDALPLKPVALHVLLVLLERDLHGYAIVKQVEQRMGKHRRILPGNLYRTLAGMEDDGLIEESDWRPDPALDDERRRYFRITQRGRHVAAAEAARLAVLVEESRAKNLLAPGRTGSP